MTDGYQPIYAWNMPRRGTKALSTVCARARAYFTAAVVLLAVGPTPSRAALTLDPRGRDTKPPQASFQLPSTEEEIQREAARIEAAIQDVKAKSATDTSTVISVWGATEAELNQRARLIQEWLLALDSRSRNLKRLQELRKTSRELAGESQSWAGFSQKPPYPIAMVEELRDRLAAQQTKASTLKTVLGIFEGNVVRYEPILEQDRKELRRLTEQAEGAGPVDRRLAWLRSLAELRLQSHEATIQSAQFERLGTIEALAAVREQIEFLRRQIQIAVPQVRFTREDFAAITNQLQARRAAVQARLTQVLLAEPALRQEQETVLASLKQAPATLHDSAAEKARIDDLKATADSVRARAETSTMKIEILRNLTALNATLQAWWEDRFWVASSPPLSDLRERHRQYASQKFHIAEWTDFLHTRLSSTLSESVGYGLQLGETNISVVRRQAAQQARATLDERTALFQEALTELSRAQDLKLRVEADIEFAMAKAGFTDRLHSALVATRGWFLRVWQTELYIAEDNIIADGQKISVPRSITVGKVICGVLILIAGLAVARGVYRLTEWLAAERFKQQEQASRLAAQGVGGLLGILALVVAMASVRIPWTVFAFMGGALVIGVGFGAQALIKNFISGLILLLERAIRVGDLVELDEHRGIVQRVGIRNSLLRRGDGADVLIPNSLFLEKKVVNWTLTDNLVRHKISLGVAYGSDTESVAALIAEATERHAGIAKKPHPEVYFQEFGEKALLFTVDFWVAVEPGVDSERVRSQLLHRLHTLLERAGIFVPLSGRELPKPSRPGAELSSSPPAGSSETNSETGKTGL